MRKGFVLSYWVSDDEIKFSFGLGFEPFRFFVSFGVYNVEVRKRERPQEKRALVMPEDIIG